MKKFTLLVVAAVVLALGLTSLAYAGVSSGYSAWSSVGYNAGTTATPHKDFRLTTQKCSVCHAVHKGDPAGEALLRGTIAGACNYCHILTGIGGVRIYNGVVGNYTGVADFATAHGNSTQARCADCHSVHGANTMTGTVSAKILKMGGFETTALLGSLGGAVGFDATNGVRDAQITVFCTKCHPYYQPLYNGDINVAGYAAPDLSVANGTWQSHVMTDSAGALASYGNAQATYSGQVAWRESQHCRDCHGAGNVDQNATLAAGTITNSNFPHYVINSARFLTAANFVTDTTTTVGADEASASLDGPCLQCHRGTATTGVGFNY